MIKKLKNYFKFFHYQNYISIRAKSKSTMLVISPSKFVATHMSNNHQTCRSMLIVQLFNDPSPFPLTKPRRKISSSLPRLIQYNKCPPLHVSLGERKDWPIARLVDGDGAGATARPKPTTRYRWWNELTLHTESEVDERHVSWLLLTTRQSNN